MSRIYRTGPGDLLLLRAPAALGLLMLSVGLAVIVGLPGARLVGLSVGLLGAVMLLMGGFLHPAAVEFDDDVVRVVYVLGITRTWRRSDLSFRLVRFLQGEVIVVGERRGAPWWRRVGESFVVHADSIPNRGDFLREVGLDAREHSSKHRRTGAGA